MAFHYLCIVKPKLQPAIAGVSVILFMSTIVEKWKEYREWQQRPSRVPQMTEEHHRCHTCGLEYQGNYCPCCGQSARIGRYSFKNALLLFLDVWGVGNRGMFRTLRDLILRPGYMIRDYISGMQMAYFPPFKLLFLLVALNLIVMSGFNLAGKSIEEETEDKEVVIKDNQDSLAEEHSKKVLTEDERYEVEYNHFVNKFMELQDKSPAIFWLVLLSVFSVPLYVLFRKSRNIPDLRFSELLVALVYTYNMMLIYQIVIGFFRLPSDLYICTLLLPIIPMKQLSGFPWWRSILNVLLAYLATYYILMWGIDGIASLYAKIKLL